jgi:hypothetical protein
MGPPRALKVRSFAAAFDDDDDDDALLILSHRRLLNIRHSSVRYSWERRACSCHG